MVRSAPRISIGEFAAVFDLIREIFGESIP
jgi:hypothetical protein